MSVNNQCCTLLHVNFPTAFSGTLKCSEIYVAGSPAVFTWMYT